MSTATETAELFHMWVSKDNAGIWYGSLAPPWQGSRPGWTGLWAPWAGGRGPCPWQGIGTG